MLPCVFKYLTGYDCPGCGIQRSLLYFIQGHLQASFSTYPALLPLLILAFYFLYQYIYRPANAAQILSILSFVAFFAVLVSYAYKMYFYFKLDVY